MSARTHTSYPTQTRGSVEVRLPWWAVALPAIAFAVLLLLISAPGQAHAAAADPALTHVLQHIEDSLSP